MSCIRQLQEMGYRLTPQRIMVVEALHGGADHISAEEIYDQVRARYPYANISTVYRTLELLKELCLVTETELGDGRTRYHSVEQSRHHHLVCHKCGTVIDIPEDVFSTLKGAFLDGYGFEADFKHMTIFGICKTCKSCR